MAPQNGRRIAFVLNSLTGKELVAGNRDASRMYTVLTAPHLGMCSPEASPPPLHGCKSMKSFQAAITKVLRDWHPDDQLLFYYSGHGVIKHGLYCLQLGQGLIPFDNVLNEMKSSGVTKGIAILDSCHSGGAVGGKKGKGENLLSTLVLPDILPSGIAIVASSRISQASFELPDGSGSVFTKLLCDAVETGLNGKATSDGYIGILDAIAYVDQQLGTETYARYPQQPMYDIRGADGSIWIAKNRSGSSIGGSHSSLIAPVNGINSLDELRLAYEHVLTSKHPCIGATVSDLARDLVEEYATIADIASNRFESDDAFLSELGFFSPVMGMSRTLHNAAVLCFSRNPEKFFPQARSLFLAGDLGSTSFIRESVTGPLSRQVQQLLRLTMSNLRSGVSHFHTGALRSDARELPEALIRELISNAVAHRDYSANGTVQVWLNRDVLEVQSPGTFPAGTSWEIFLNGDRVSCPADPAISLYLTRLLAFEGVGRGFSVFRDYVSQNGPESMTCDVLPGPTIRIRVLRPQFETPTTALPRVRILLLNSNPFTHSPLALDFEAREITSRIRASGLRDRFELSVHLVTRPDDLLQAFNEYRPQIVQFSGHGGGGGELQVSDGSGGVKPITRTALANLFRLMKDDIRVVILNACYSRPQAEAIAEHIDCTVGIAQAITDEAAIRFSAAFFGALAFGRSIKDAFDQGIAALMLEGLDDYGLPELIVREGVNPAEVMLV